MKKTVQIECSKEELIALIKEAVSGSTASKKEVREPIYYTRKEVASLLKVHLNSIDNYRRAGLLNFVEIGGTLRISKDQVDSLLNNLKTSSDD